jgi:Transcriptional regulators
MPKTDVETKPDALLTRPLRELVTFRLARLNAKLTAQASRKLAESAGISLTQWRVFALLDTEGIDTAAELARHTHFDKALISRTVRGMIEDGYLLATPSKTDQRSTLLALTDRGRRVAAHARPVMRDRQETLLASLSPEDLATFFACIDALDATVDRMEATEQRAAPE